MKIRMLQTVPGSIDGSRVTEYESGVEYDLTATPGAVDLASAFVVAGMAEEARLVERKPAEAPENKMLDDAPAEKSAKAKK